MDLDFIAGKSFEWLRGNFPHKTIGEILRCVAGIISALVRTLQLIEQINEPNADQANDEAIIQELNMLWVFIFDSLRNGNLIQELDLQLIQFDN